MEYFSELICFVVGLAGGSLVTFMISKKSVSGSGRMVDQQSAKASGDIVGGNKTVKSDHSGK